jgi:hypothetical protein
MYTSTYLENTLGKEAFQAQLPLIFLTGNFREADIFALSSLCFIFFGSQIQKRT